MHFGDKLKFVVADGQTVGYCVAARIVGWYFYFLRFAGQRRVVASPHPVGKQAGVPVSRAEDEQIATELVKRKGD